MCAKLLAAFWLLSVHQTSNAGSRLLPRTPVKPRESECVWFLRRDFVLLFKVSGGLTLTARRESGAGKSFVVCARLVETFYLLLTSVKQWALDFL